MQVDQRKFRVVLAATGLTQARLAALLGISRATLQRRLDGAIPWRRRELKLFRRVLGVNVAELAAPTAAEVLARIPKSTPPAEQCEVWIFPGGGPDGGVES